MPKHLFTAVAICCATVGYSQEVVSTQGDSYANASGSIDFTIGEVVIITVSDGSNDLTQGFHQTHWNFVGLDDHQPDFVADIFPNPTEDYINIRSSRFENVNYQLFDSRGRVVLQGILSDEITNLDVGELTTGSYSLLLKREEQSLKTFKLIKHH